MYNSHDSADTASFTHYFRPAKGHWKYSLLNLLLRTTVKWRHGLEVDVGSVRKQVAKLDRQAPSQLPGIKRQQADCGGVSGEWLVPGNHRDNRVLLYIHGGAFVASTPDVHAAMVAPWCQSLQARALMVDYRLAPEHPFPAASDDCFAVYKWLLDQGFESRDIVIAGDSAGGNLVLSTLLRLKAEQLALPACAVLLSPFLDFTLSGKSALTNARRDPIFTSAFAIGIRNHYAPAELHSDPRVSPLLGDFSGLPPMLFQVGSTEMLLDDSVRAAARANDTGVPVQLDIWEALPHVFQTIDALPQAKVAAQRICRFVAENTEWDQS